MIRVKQSGRMMQPEERNYPLTNQTDCICIEVAVLCRVQKKKTGFTNLFTVIVQ